MMGELLLGLEAIHKKDIIHRDIKPDNIFMSKDLSVIKYGDFGASKFICKGHSSYPTRVSKSYRAPEVMCGCTIHTTKLDVWSLGCVFLEFFSLLPFFKVKDSDSEQFFHFLKVRGGFNSAVAKAYKSLYQKKEHAKIMDEALFQ